VITETVIAPVHPGEILLEEFLGPLGVSQYQLAKAVGVPARLMPTRTISLNSPPARHHDFSDVDGSVDQSKHHSQNHADLPRWPAKRRLARARTAD